MRVTVARLAPTPGPSPDFRGGEHGSRAGFVPPPPELGEGARGWGSVLQRRLGPMITPQPISSHASHRFPRFHLAQGAIADVGSKFGSGERICRQSLSDA